MCKKTLTLIFLCFFSFSGNAQLSIKNIDIQAGATLMDWDGLFGNFPSNFTAKEGYFVGISFQLQNKNEGQGSIYSSILYRKTHTDYKWNFERIKLDEISWSIGLGHKWKKLTFGVNCSFVYILSKEKIDNTPLTGLEIENIEKFYLSLSGKISFSIFPRISVFIEQALLNTRVHHTYSMQRGELFEVPSYPGWTLLGLSYSITQEE